MTRDGDSSRESAGCAAPHGARDFALDGAAMGRVAVIAFTRKGCALARALADALPGSRVVASAPERYAGEFGLGAYEGLAAWTAEHFPSDDALVFVGASGIAVRAIAPYVRDKFNDPAVVSVDEAGRFAVPLLSGHVGGANELARRVAEITGGQAVVSTATDVNGLFAVDEWAARNGFAIVERAIAKEVSAALLDGRPVGFKTDFELQDAPWGVVEGQADVGFHVTLDETSEPFCRTLHLVPRVVTVGVGCRKGTDPVAFERAVMDALACASVSPRAVRMLASIDVKRHERAILELASKMGWELRFFSAEELAAVPGRFESSDFVERTVGVGNVCERAACAGGEALLAGKRARDGVTVALARGRLG